MSDAIDETLREWRRTGHRYGVSDCLLSVADHAGRIAGADIGAAYRGTYADEAAALKIVAEAGGAVNLLGRHLESAGWRRIDAAEAARGDCLVVTFRNGAEGLQVGALHAGRRIVMRLAQGAIEVRPADVEILGAWRQC